MRKYLFILLWFLLLGTSITSTPGTTVDGGGDDEFLNPNNAQTENGVSATAIGLGGGTSQYLNTTNYGFTVTAGSTINGILVERKMSCLVDGDVETDHAKLIIDGSVSDIGADAPNGGNLLTTTLTFYNDGGATDTWTSQLPTVTQINASNFGVQSRTVGNESSTTSIDVVKMTIYFTEPAGAKKHIIGYGNGKTETFFDSKGE